jgi:phosphotriesterase-related protein
MPTRRHFIRTLTAAVGAAAVGRLRSTAAESPAAHIQTVTGPILPEALGRTLIHEHVLVDFIGADRVSPDRYDRDEAFRVALPHLERVRTQGCRTLVECTPAWLGRDPILLQRLSRASGLQILTNTGYYGAAGDRFVPAHAYDETAGQLADRWTREWEEGIDGTGIRPAFMKIGVDPGPLSRIDEKLVRAAALTHRRTGLPIASHTGDGTAALAQLDRLEIEGVAASAFIWVHAQNERDSAAHVRAARTGAWLSFDGISETSLDRHVQLVMAMRAGGFLERVLISQDAGWYRVGEPGGGTFRGYETIFVDFLPALRQAGATEEDVEQLLVTNPRRAFSPPERHARSEQAPHLPTRLTTID